MTEEQLKEALEKAYNMGWKDAMNEAQRILMPTINEAKEQIEKVREVNDQVRKALTL